MHSDTSKRQLLSDYEYIIVGSGAGGGPLASRLALNGAKVLLIEAGDDQGLTPQESIPAFFPAASEYAPMSWDFYVRHYSDDAREKLNSKATYRQTNGSLYIGTSPPAGATFLGVWYPRSGTLGGCGAHNAMVTVYPHEKDWTDLEQLTGDSSWSAENMRKYFERIERNQYLTNPTGDEAAGHGFDGWLGTDEMNLNLVAEDPQTLAMLSATKTAFSGQKTNITDAASLGAIFPLDLNTAYPDRDTTQEIYRIPEAISNGARSSPRDLLVDTAAKLALNGSGKLDIRTNCLVTKIRFDTSNASEPRAVGVDFLQGQYLYSASSMASNATIPIPGSVNASKEVIISAGTFNTPQILKLSGIGPAAELKKFNIPVVKDLPGVGANLQDHYEISNVIEADTSYALLENCTWLSTGPLDPCYIEYTTGANYRGPYATTLLPGAVLKTSSTSVDKTRDTFVFGGPIKFTGYFQGYTNVAISSTKFWSWVILKAHEANHAGTVTLRSANPRDVPNINFNYFDTGSPNYQSDLQAMVEGIEFTREIYGNISAPYDKFTEVYPGSNTTTTAGLESFIEKESWGHHATGTAKIGKADDTMAVLDGNFRVRGVSGLRVVDASVFPQIPGVFPVTSVYMISEKAADVILGGQS